jgi:hypothetical protein
MKWYIPDCYLGSVSHGSSLTHEAVCVLNPGKTDADVKMTLLFEDRAEMPGFSASVRARSTNHIRLDKIVNGNGEIIPRDLPYAMEIDCDVPIRIQYTRVDTSQEELALMSVIV